jgi:SAM-dependent methyltransferase
MTVFERLAGQLRKPSGVTGRLLISRVLDLANADMNRSTLELLDIEAGDQVIEVGFGGGYLVRRIAPLVGWGRVVGVDFSPEMVASSTHRLRRSIREGRVELRCAGADALPYGSGQFAKACTVNTIYFWPDCSGPLRELSRVLEDGGRLVVSFSPPAKLQRAPWARHGFTHYEPEQVQRMLEDAGFVDVHAERGSSRVDDFCCVVGTKRAEAVV